VAEMRTRTRHVKIFYTRSPLQAFIPLESIWKCQILFFLHEFCRIEAENLSLCRVLEVGAIINGQSKVAPLAKVGED